MRTVGRRPVVGGGIAEQRAYARTAATLRGTPFLVPCGVFRFDSFDEAQSWMDRTIRRTHARLSRTISSGSAGR